MCGIKEREAPKMMEIYKLVDLIMLVPLALEMWGAEQI